MTKSSIAFMTMAVILVVVVKGQSGSVKKERAVIKGKKITIEHGKPSANRKQSFREAVPYGKIWEAGAANLTTEAGLTFGKCLVPAGSYTLFPLPKEGEEWTIIFSKRTTKYDQAAELCGQSFGKPSSVSRERKNDTVYIVRTPTNLFNLGFSLLRFSWLDVEVDSPMYVDF